MNELENLKDKIKLLLGDKGQDLSGEYITHLLLAKIIDLLETANAKETPRRTPKTPVPKPQTSW